MEDKKLEELLCQALETELGGVQVYTTALRCVVNEDLKEEWEKYLEQTQRHVEIVRDTMATLAAKKAKGGAAKALKAAHEEVEEQEDEHLYHTQGWARELWIETLGMPAVLPPPEEEKDVKTAIGAARAKQARTNML